MCTSMDTHFPALFNDAICSMASLGPSVSRQSFPSAFRVAQLGELIGVRKSSGEEKPKVLFRHTQKLSTVCCDARIRFRVSLVSLSQLRCPNFLWLFFASFFLFFFF